MISSTWWLRFVVFPMDTSFRALAAAALLLVSCTTSLSQDDRPCPCVSGWTCCAGSNLCAREARICPAVVDTEAPPAPVLAGSVPAPPTNQTQVEVFGDAEAGARVDLFTNDACGGPVAASGAADALGHFRVAVQIAANATTAVSAHAVDVAGNVSQCTAQALSLVHDGVPPSAPILIAVAPAAISNLVTEPEISGTADPGATVVLYDGKDCLHELAFAGATDPSGTFRIRARVDPDTVSVFAARAFDKAGNASDCAAGTLRFQHDDIAPSPPALIGTSPWSPNRDPAPTVAVSAEAGAAVRLFGAAGCAGAMFDEGIAAPDGSVSFAVAVAHDTATTFSARAADEAGNVSGCSEGFQYVHDDIPPGPVASATFLTGSTAQTLHPVVVGVVQDPEPGETVLLWDDWGDPTGPVAVDADGFFHAAMTVRANQTTGITVRPADAAGNVAGEFRVGWFTNDTIPPEPPQVSTTSVPSPSAVETTFTVAGTKAESESRIDLFADSTCQQPLRAFSLGWQPSPFWQSLLVVSPNTRTEIYATATDLAGNRSACSSSHLTFVHGLPGPGWDYPRAAEASKQTVMAPDGTAWSLREHSPGTGQVDVSVVEARPGDGWDAAKPIVSIVGLPGVENNTQNAWVAAEAAGRIVVAWVTNSATVGALHARVRSADGTWSDDEIISTHTGSAHYVSGAALVADRAGGAWALWGPRVLQVNGSYEAWVSHHDPASGWSTPIRMFSGFPAVMRLVAGASGHAMIAMDFFDTLPSGTLQRQFWFYDPASGWTAPEMSEYLGPLGPAAMDDRGRGVITFRDNKFSVLTTRRHLPDTGWEASVSRGPVAPSYVSQVGLQLNAAGDAALTWSTRTDTIGPPDPRPFFVQRYTDASGWSAAEQVGTVDEMGPIFTTDSFAPAVSLGLDGSVWIVASGVTPKMQMRLYPVGNPSWLLRFDPQSAWSPPQWVFDDASATVLRNDGGTALLLRRDAMRWFH